jgi:hypothetical protein
MSSLHLIFRCSFTLALATAIALPALAQDPVPAVEKKKKERLVCETIMTGTRIRNQRVCMTRGQWRVANDRNREDLKAGREQQQVVSFGVGGRSTYSTSSSTAC